MIKSPYYYDKLAVHLDKIVFEIETDAAAAAAALQAGDHPGARLDLDDRAPRASSRTRACGVLEQSTIGFARSMINIGNKNGLGNLPYTNVGTPLASSPMLRQAFEEAIDRKALNKVVFRRPSPAARRLAPATRLVRLDEVPCTPVRPGRREEARRRLGIPNPTVHLL